MTTKILRSRVQSGLTVALFGIARTYAQVIAVQYGPSTGYVTGDIVFQQHPNQSGTEIVMQRSLSLTDAWSPSSGYGGPEFYGGLYQRIVLNTSLTTDQHPALVGNNVALPPGGPVYDILRFRSVRSSGSNIVSEQQNFVVLFPVQTAPLGPGEYYVFGPDSSLSWTRNLGFEAGVRTFRFVVVTGALQYYVSGELSTSGSVVTSTLSNPATALWAAWTPGTDLSFGSLSFDAPGSSLQNITHVGVAVNRTVSTPNTRVPVLDLMSLEANLRVIPEPSTAALLATFGFASLVLRRHNSSRIRARA